MENLKAVAISVIANAIYSAILFALSFQVTTPLKAVWMGLGLFVLTSAYWTWVLLKRQGDQVASDIATIRKILDGHKTDVYIPQTGDLPKQTVIRDVQSWHDLLLGVERRYSKKNH